MDEENPVASSEQNLLPNHAGPNFAMESHTACKPGGSKIIRAAQNRQAQLQLRLPKAGSSSNIKSAELTLVAYQKLNREWRAHLSASERDFISWFIDNTIALGRPWLRATISQMSKGTRALVPAGQSVRTLERALPSLQKAGLIVMRPGEKVNDYAINLCWLPKEELEDGTLAAMGGPKCRNTTSDTNDGVAGVLRQIGGPNNHEGFCSDKENKKKMKRSSDAAHRVNGLAPWEIKDDVTVCQTPRQRNAVASETDANRQPKKIVPLRVALKCVPDGSYPPTMQNEPPTRRKRPSQSMTADWSAAWQATYDVPVKHLTQRDVAMLTDLRKHFERGRVDWTDFLYWFVAQWKPLMATKFLWMRKRNPPAYPEAWMLVRFSNDFLDAYAERIDRKLTETSPPEKADYRKLIASGMTHDEAMLEIGARRAISMDREQRAKDRAHVNRMYRVIETERKKLEKQRLMAPAPVEPNKTRTVMPEIKHGDNPFEQENPQVLDFSTLDLQWED